MIPLRLMLYGAAALTVLIVIGAVAWNFDPFNRRKNAEQKAANAEAQVQSSDATIQAQDRLVHDITVIREKAEPHLEAVRAAPGADDPVPVEVLEAWKKGLAGE